MKTIKELEANTEIGHREKVIIKMWLNQYKEDVLELIDELKQPCYLAVIIATRLNLNLGEQDIVSKTIQEWLNKELKARIEE